MIQRIQTVYLLLAELLTVLLYAFDFAELSANGELMVFNASGIFSGEKVVIDGLPIFLFIGLIVLLHLIIILLYKKRILQIRITVFTIILLFGLLGVMFYFIYFAFKDASVVYKIPMVFPLIAVILDYLALRNIGKDEALIRSMDRIR